ncbi:serine hydrolase domain-containing protein [Amycolatopsis suaedae]|uniref:Class A beta-lactamase-related serine hydrolase n=1 Tax=Amycolatopsis suaedae TaxID=2510978 RepID=A0A4Q7J2J6_9PSEU|nr:serine hydrolase domain-containing protein [Amycolatopsis suaedae]RZQ60812.1 class A beta-lactamase-related serine hydrolase [Amycolatopsis suaedae]
MVRTRIVAAIALTASLLTAAPAVATGRPVQPHLDALTAAGISGVLTEVDIGGHRYAARSGVATRGSDRPVPYGSHFRIASVTKTFVAVVVLQLVAEGRLALSDTVEQHLPGLVAGNGNDGSRISVRQLLQHTSGLYDYSHDLPLNTEREFMAHRFDSYTDHQLVTMAMKHRPEFEPGTSWNYSNTNYVLAGLLIQKLTGHSWQHAVSERILRPLRMHDTFDPGYWPGLPRPHATGYTVFPGGEPVDTTRMLPRWSSAAGSMISTTGDVLTFWKALLGGRLLPQAQLTEMRTTVLAVTWQETDPGAEYGLGIGSDPLPCGGKRWGHGGDIHGFATEAAFAEDGGKGVVLSQSTQIIGNTEVREKAKAVLEHVLC